MLTALPESERAADCKNLNLEHVQTEWALGVRWDIKSDTLGITVTSMDDANTRRGCLSPASSHYDPFGLVGPVPLVAKRVLRMSWKLKLAWDDTFTGKLLEARVQWEANLSDLGGIRIPRCYFSLEGLALMELHHFTDASDIGYGTVSYLRKIDEDVQIECCFIMAGKKSYSTFPICYCAEIGTSGSSRSRENRWSHEQRDWSSYCKGYLLDRFQNNPAIHTERDTMIQDVCGKQCVGDQGFLKARTAEIRPRKGHFYWRCVKGPNCPVLPSERAMVSRAYLSLAS